MKRNTIKAIIRPYVRNRFLGKVWIINILVTINTISNIWKGNWMSNNLSNNSGMMKKEKSPAKKIG